MMNVNIFDNDMEDLEDVLVILNYIPRPRHIYERADYFHEMSDDRFFERFRLTKRTVLSILEQIEQELEYPYDKNNSISPINQILVCLRVFATGGHLLSIADFGGMHKSTVSRIVVRVSRALAQLIPQYVKFPTTQDEIARAQNQFYDLYRFPRVVGAIDCTHVRIQSPGHDDAEVFRNRKSYFSINTQVICNAQKKITNIVARWPGSTHDVTIFNNSRIRGQFEAGRFPQCILLGDGGYRVRNFMLTPYLNPGDRAQQLYNQSHIRTRTIVENVFGIWKRRFPILAYGCRLKLQTTLIVITATAVLYNIARNYNEPEPVIGEGQDPHILQQLIEDGQIPDVINNNVNAAAGFDLRNELTYNYFARL